MIIYSKIISYYHSGEERKTHFVKMFFKCYVAVFLVPLILQKTRAQNGCNFNPCGSNSICTPAGTNSYSCRCQVGFESPNGRNCFLSAVSPNSNTNNQQYRTGSLCQRENCGQYANCLEIGNEAVCQCQPGYYSISGSQKDCRDINECSLQPCGTFSSCINTIGSYRCQCFNEYISDYGDNTNCRPTNPSRNCNFGHTCGSNSRCARINTVSNAHRCHCEHGYFSSNTKNCRDRNECTSSPRAACGSNAVCLNTIGSFRCTCNTGFERDELNSRCVDIDECRDRPCGSNAACMNTYGSYQCKCFPGYMSMRSDQTNCQEDPDNEELRVDMTRDHSLEEDLPCSTAVIIGSVALGLFIFVVIFAIIYFIMKRRKKSEGRPQGISKNSRQHINSISSKPFSHGSSLTPSDVDESLNMAYSDGENLSDTSGIENDKRAGFDFNGNNNFVQNSGFNKISPSQLSYSPAEDNNKAFPYSVNDDVEYSQANRPNSASPPSSERSYDGKPPVAPKPITRQKKPNPLIEELKTNGLFKEHVKQTTSNNSDNVTVDNTNSNNNNNNNNNKQESIHSNGSNVYQPVSETVPKDTKNTSDGGSNGYMTPSVKQTPTEAENVTAF